MGRMNLKMRLVQPRDCRVSFTDTNGEYHIPNMMETPEAQFRLWQAERVIGDDFFKDFISEEDMKRLEVG